MGNRRCCQDLFSLLGNIFFAYHSRLTAAKFSRESDPPRILQTASLRWRHLVRSRREETYCGRATAPEPSRQ